MNMHNPQIEKWLEQSQRQKEKTMMSNNSLSWLLEMDDPGVRYLALKDLLDLPTDDPDLLAARERAYHDGPIAIILSKMNPEGFWAEPGAGYRPKYWSTVWCLIMLAQLGANVNGDNRIQKACDYLMDQAFNEGGQFSISGTPSTTADCLQGNLCWALMELGYQDSRLATAFEWMARTVTGEGLAPKEDNKAPIRYYASQCGPTFACGSNNKLPCAWGGSKVMGAFSTLPKTKRTPLIDSAIQHGVNFLLGIDPAEADYPSGFSPKPSGNWWKFGFPVFYVTDMLQIIEVLIRLGYGKDPRLSNALRVILEKQDDVGRWPMEYSYTGKTWVDFGPKKEANKWVTLRAMRVLKTVGQDMVKK
jgi:hypothetical protein